MLLPRTCLVRLALSAALAGSLYAQAPLPQDTDSPAATLKINVRTVLVDVVVQDNHNHAVPGLHKEDFQLLEDGKPQQISFFEPNFAADGGTPNLAAPPPLPPNTFTNVPAVAPNDSINVLLMDALNTPLADQVYVHKQMVKYLGSIPPGIRIGVFLLGERLRIIQGFTQDSTVLRKSISRLASNPSTSALMPTPNSTGAQDNVIGMIQEQAVAQASVQLAEMAAGLQQFLDQQSAFEVNERTVMTLDALQQIARYLAGVPGRKNLMWFAGSIPLCLPVVTSETEPINGGCPYEEKYKKTLTMLADARVSLYPIDASGLATDSTLESGGPAITAGITAVGAMNLVPGAPTSAGSAPFQVLNANQVGQMGSDAQQRALAHLKMEELAENTGGKAIYEHNAMKKSIAEDIDNGSRYYTLAYTPSNRLEVGKERKIEIKATSGSYKLSYRRSYFEATPKELKASEMAPGKDPLRPLMDRGMPNFTQVRYRMKVAPSSAQPAAGAARAGDNTTLKGPLTRYTVDFSLKADELALAQSPDGVRSGIIEVALVAYSQDGRPLNWVVRGMNVGVRPEQYPMAQSSGIPFHFDIDAPRGDVYLRTGIYDIASSKAGTLEIPLSVVTMAKR
jgi:VWFA-related protein